MTPTIAERKRRAERNTQTIDELRAEAKRQCQFLADLFWRFRPDATDEQTETKEAAEAR